MLIEIEISPEDFEKISKLIEQGKYTDIKQFMKVALSNLITREAHHAQLEPLIPSGEESAQHTKLEKIDLGGLSETERARRIHDYSGYLELKHRDFLMTKQFLSEFLKKFSVSNQVKYFGAAPTISNFVSRLFPIKLIIIECANRLKIQETKWITLSEIEENAYDLAVIYSEKLRLHEEQMKLPRHKKLSTGLPLPLSAKKGKRGRGSTRTDIKISASKERFIDYFIGKQITERKNEKYELIVEEGICMDMGLIGFSFEENSGEIYFTLTQEGKEFAQLNNPVINNDDFSKAFSEEEAEFLLNKIIPRFELENAIVRRILKELSENESLESTAIDKIFESEKKIYRELKSKEKITGAYEKHRIKLFEDFKNFKECPKCGSKKFSFDEEESMFVCGSSLKHVFRNPNSAERVATMGRLSELGIVDWIVGTRGKSTYKLNTQLYEKIKN